MANESPKRKFLNQSPLEVIQTNRVPFFIGVLIFMCLLAYFMYRTQDKPKTILDDKAPKQKLQLSDKDDEKEWYDQEKYKAYSLKNVVAKELPKTVEEIVHQTISNQETSLKQVMISDDYATKIEIKKMENKAKIEEKKLEFLAEQAPLQINVSGQSQINEAGKGTMESIESQINKIPGLNKTIDAPQYPQPPGSEDVNNQDEKKDFVKNGENEDFYLKKGKQKPLSPFEVKAGTTIPAALISGINSDLPGSLTAQVVENVYDTVTGNTILIPQGSKIIGTYDSKVTYGQSRALVVWTRLIFPDGSSIDLERMQGIDISGYSGLKDKLDNHYLKIYGNALLLSLVGAGYDTLNKHAQQSSDTRDTVAASIGQKLAEVGSKSMEKNMNVQPTIIIRPGYKFNVFVMKDMVLEEIKDVDGTLLYTN
jgi:type IV secretory pathway VirB10-like protein